MKVGRNDACPCGSGRKVKRCCGVDVVRDRARCQDEVAAELVDLAFHFPRYRPASVEFDRWALTAPESLTREALEAGGTCLGEAERERIRNGFRIDHPQMWSSVVADFGDEELAADLVLAGAVVAGVTERLRPLDPEVLWLLEQDADMRDDPVEVLALSLEGRDLWSVIESAETVDAIDASAEDRTEAAYRAAAERLATEWHEERLAVLVERVRERLPDPSYPLASAALANACARVAADRKLASRLRAELLLDSLPSVFDALLAAA
ncbi:MAG: SEC-C metal-binding domain-containing protein [Gaiellaceae bacterium]